MEPRRKIDYIKIAEEERQRYRNIAKAHLKNGPSIQNLYNAVSSWWKSLPINTNASTVNPRMNTGEPVILPGRVPTKGIKIPKITSANASKITPKQWDVAYNTAINSGDAEEIQRLRDLHFYSKSYKSKESKSLYKHSTYSEPFYKFNLDAKPNYSMSSRNGKGIYLEDYGDLSKMEQLEKRIIRGYNGSYGDNTMNLRVNFKSPENIHNYSDVPMSNHPEGYISDYESFIRDPKMIKSDNAITYDDAGNIIPLSKRDNFSINDIRYLLPFAIGGGIGYGLYNSSQQ